MPHRKGFSSAKLAELNSQLQRVETEVLDVYEKILSKQPYLCGSVRTSSLLGEMTLNGM